MSDFPNLIEKPDPIERVIERVFRYVEMLIVCTALQLAAKHANSEVLLVAGYVLVAMAGIYATMPVSIWLTTYALTTPGRTWRSRLVKAGCTVAVIAAGQLAVLYGKTIVDEMIASDPTPSTCPPTTAV